MSNTTPIESTLNQPIEENKKLIDKFSLSNYNAKKLPKWLLEFDTFTLNKKHETNSRPFTENSASEKPKWFTELVQQRRLSETSFIPNGEFNSNLFNAESNSLNLSDFEDLKINRNREKSLHETEELNCFLSGNRALSCPSIPKQIDYEIDSIGSTDIIDDEILNSLSVRKAKMESVLDDQDFIIPELPFGKELLFEIKTNWGDSDYVGLNGIEILHSNGNEMIKIDKLWSEPHSMNGNLGALIDGIYRTHDDSHIWLTKFNDKNTLPIKLWIRFQSFVSIAIIRIWNYNKSRIYSYRGVRYLIIKLDNRVVFKGEIAKACGELQGSPQVFGDTILFTIDEKILEDIAERDVSFQELITEIMPKTQDI